MNFERFSVQGVIALFVAVAFVSLVLVWMLRPPTGDPAQLALLNALIMVVGTGFLTVINFFFGSSTGSSNKDATITKLSQQHDPAPVAPLAPVTLSDSPKALGAALVVVFIIGLSLLANSGAYAQATTRRPLPLTGDIKTDFGNAVSNRVTSAATSGASNAASILAKPFQDIAEFLSSDADGAIALSTQIPDLKDGHGQQCWIAMSKAGQVFKAHPIPLTLKAMTDLEALRLLAITANNLCSNVHCTQVFADTTTMAQAASPVPLIIPGLHDLCAKIPQIAVVPPIDFTPAPTPVTAPAPAPPASTNQ